MADVESRVHELEGKVAYLTEKYIELAQQGKLNHKNIQELGTKLDDIRDDIKRELQNLSSNYMPRDEFEKQVKQTERALGKISKEIQDNTKWTIGTMISILGLIASAGLVLVSVMQHH